MDPNGTTVTTCIICTLIEAVSRTLACPPGAADNSSEGTGVADYKRVGLIASTSDVFRPLLRCESLSASESVKRASTPWTKEPLEPCTLKAQSSTASDGSARARSRARAQSRPCRASAPGQDFVHDLSMCRFLRGLGLCFLQIWVCGSGLVNLDHGCVRYGRRSK